MLQTLKAKYKSNFKYLEEKLAPKPVTNEFDNTALKTEVNHFLTNVIEPSLEEKVRSYLTSSCNQFQSKFDVTIWYAGSGNILGLVDNDFSYDTPYSKKDSKRIFNFISSDDVAEIYKYIKYFAKYFDIDVDDYDFEGSKCLKASVDYKK